nr:hypothetical protein [Actinopolymorpha alba]
MILRQSRAEQHGKSVAAFGAAVEHTTAGPGTGDDAGVAEHSQVGADRTKGDAKRSAC